MEFTCAVCGNLFKFKSSLKRHLKKVHKKQPDYDKNYYVCIEKGCEHKFRRNTDFVYHLQTKHSVNIEHEEKQFLSLKDFLSWKQQIEIDENCNYAVACGTKSLTSGDIVSYYKCNRSGVYKSKALKGNRTLKSQGTCKINKACSSQITLYKHPDNTLSLLRIITHYGHRNDLQHVRLPKAERENIAAKLVSGVSQTRILDTYRTKIGSEIKRANLVTNRDLLNIKRDYKINVQEDMTEDAASIELWVEECKTQDNNPVLFYKKHGDSHEHLSDNSFCLILMNEYQKAMLCTFGKNIVAVDSTHGFDNYDFELTTVMVLDDYGEGFPVCCMFANRTETSGTYMSHFLFEKIREAVGVIQAKTFIGDITEVHFNAWFSVMGNVEQKLYCSCHINREWQKNISEIQNGITRKKVYKTLQTLQLSMDIKHFQQNLKTFIENVAEDPDTQSFAEYFTTTYAHNFQQWAYCFREEYGINTNCVLESMHKTVKYLCRTGKSVKTLDKGLHAVLECIRDKIVKRTIQTTKEEHAYTVKGVIQHPKLSIAGSSHVENIDSNLNPPASGNIDLHRRSIAINLGPPSKPNICKEQVVGKILFTLKSVVSKLHDINLKTIDESLLSQMLSQTENLENLLNISSSSSSQHSLKEVDSVTTNKDIKKELKFPSTKKKKPNKMEHTKLTSDEKKDISNSDTLLFISSSSVNDHIYCS